MHTIQLIESGEFTTETGETIHDAATRAGINLNYSCKNGRCSTCKCKVISGKTISLQPETGLSDQEVKEGYILTCVRTAETDLVLEIDKLNNIELPPVKTLPCRINQINHLTDDVIQVFLRLPPTIEFNFIPGQYIDVIGPNGIRRSYSLANASAADKQLELHIRAVEGGEMSQYWFKQAKNNDLLRLNGPMGTFFLREPTDRDLVFLATGTGIAPVKAMLELIANLSDEQSPKSVTVLWGGRKPQDIYIDFSDKIHGLNYISVLSHPDASWTGARGYVQDVLLGENPDMSNAEVYACGSDAMIHSAKNSLVDAGLPPQQFYSDAFVASGNT